MAHRFKESRNEQLVRLDAKLVCISKVAFKLRGSPVDGLHCVDPFRRKFRAGRSRGNEGNGPMVKELVNSIQAKGLPRELLDILPRSKPKVSTLMEKLGVKPSQFDGMR